jgi:hypothetical protein
METNTSTQIGIATITYDNTGMAMSATFEHSLKISSSDSVINSLKTIKQRDVPTMTENAETVMAEWFTKMNEVELADRDQYKISGEVVECEMNGKGMPKRIRISFSFSNR